MTTYRNAMAEIFASAAETGDIVSWEETLSFHSEGAARVWMGRMTANDVRSARQQGVQIVIKMHNETEGLVDELRCIQFIIAEGIAWGQAPAGHQVRMGLVA